MTVPSHVAEGTCSHFFRWIPVPFKDYLVGCRVQQANFFLPSRTLFQLTPRISAWRGQIRILIVQFCAERDALEVHVQVGMRATKNHGVVTCPGQFPEQTSFLC